MASDFKKSGIVALAKTGNESLSAYRAARNNYNGLASPVLGFDDFRLSSDVFGPHQHKHMSALTYLFEDSAPYHNIDSMGNDLVIAPGSLLWTWGGSGVTHHEYPETRGTKIHGLQLFLEIPAETRNLPPQSISIPVTKMQVQESEGVRMKLVMGKAAGLANSVATPEDITMIDLALGAGKRFAHALPAHWHGMVYVMTGTVELGTPEGIVTLNAQETVAMGFSEEAASIRFFATTESHLLFISGLPVA